MGGLGRGVIYIQECGSPDTDTRQFVGGLGRHVRVIIYTGLSKIDYTLGYLRLTLDLSCNPTQCGCNSMQPEKAWLLQPDKAWLLHMN